MKNKVMWVILAVALAGSMASGKTLFERMFGARIPEDAKKAENAPVPGESVANLNVKEAMLKLVDHAGEVIRIKFDNVHAMRQVEKGYVAIISYEGRSIWDGMLVFIPNEGLEFFEKQVVTEQRSNKEVFVQLSAGGVNRALGIRTRSGEGAERYDW